MPRCVTSGCGPCNKRPPCSRSSSGSATCSRARCSSLSEDEKQINREFQDARDGLWNSITHLMSSIGNTEYVIGVCLIVVGLVWWRTKQWWYLQILLAAKPEAATKNLLSALKDTDKGYRNAALNFASGFADQNVYIEVMKHMLKAKPEVKVDILNWIGRESKCPSKHDMIKNLELRFDLPARQVLWSN